MTSDLQLLQAHRDGDAEAFAELARRHVDWIHNVARRRVGGDVQLAEDVTQATFIALAKQAAHIRSPMVLPAWLFRVTCFIAAQVRRAESRRRKHERASVATQRTACEEPGDDSSPDWHALAPVIDEFVGRLRQSDREAILLRFYRQLTFVEVGDVLGITEEAARKRVTRALEQLQSLARRRGLMLGGAAGLSVALTHGFASSTVAAAPAGTTALITTAASAGTSSTTALAGHSAALAKGVFLMTTTSKIVLVSAAVVVTVGGVVVVNHATKTAPPPPATMSAAPPLSDDQNNKNLAGLAVAKVTPPPLVDDQAGADGVDQYGWTRELTSAAAMMKQVAVALSMSTNEKTDRLPASLGELVTLFNPPSTPTEAAAPFLTPADLKTTTMPAKVDAAWIDAHTSYTYLAAGASSRALNIYPLPGQTIAFYTSLEKPFTHPRVGKVILAAFVDGHIEVLPVDAARKIIAASKREIAKATTQPAK